MYCRTFTTTRASPMVSLKPPEEPQIDIVDVGGRAHRRVHQARVSIHANVSLHAEVPLGSLLGLVHLRVALSRLVLGRTRRRDERGVHCRAFFSR